MFNLKNKTVFQFECGADVVTSLWLGNIALPKELFNVLSLHGNILQTNIWNK